MSPWYRLLCTAPLVGLGWLWSCTGQVIQTRPPTHDSDSVRPFGDSTNGEEPETTDGGSDPGSIAGDPNVAGDPYMAGDPSMPGDPQSVADKRRGHLPQGYFVAQLVEVFNQSQYGAISTVDEAEAIFTDVAGRLDGVELYPIWYGATDVAATRAIAGVAQTHGIDVWHGTFNLMDRIRGIVTVPAEHQAYVMENDGTIVPAVTRSDGSRQLDVLSPEAMDWLLPLYRSAYIEPMRGYLNGLFFDEDRIPDRLESGYGFTKPPDYRRLIVYSPRVLSLWRSYCVAHDVRDASGTLVDSFPVADIALEAQGAGQTKYFTGYGLPVSIASGDVFMTLPKPEGVWRAWWDFLAEQFANNWIKRLAAAFHDVNADNPKWYGAIYFQLHTWGLAYEQIQNPTMVVDGGQRWGAWGRQRGVDLTQIASLPEVDYVICETFPRIASNLPAFIGEFSRITAQANKPFGVELHRDDNGPLGSSDTEADRWALIHTVAPTLLSRFSVRHVMLSTGQYYDSAQEAQFHTYWQAYRQQR